MSKPSGSWWRARGKAQWVCVVQELSRAKAAALSERSQAEEELVKAKNQVRLEEVSPRPWPRKGLAHCSQRPPGSRA